MLYLIIELLDINFINMPVVIKYLEIITAINIYLCSPSPDPDTNSKW